LGLSISLLPLNVKSPLGMNFSGSLNGLFSADDTPLPYPSPFADHDFNSAKGSLELSWSPGIFQFKTKWGYGVTAKKEGQWDTSFNASVRHKPGRFSVKFATPNFPEKWNCTLSWSVEKK
jgi:hypothetical protein